MPNTGDVTLHVPAELVSKCEDILRVLGLSADEAVRLFLARVSLRRGLPFAMALPPEASVDQDDDLLAPALRRQATSVAGGGWRPPGAMGLGARGADGARRSPATFAITKGQLKNALEYVRVALRYILEP